MSVYTETVHVYICTCDVCGKLAEIQENHAKGIYNRAQAVRSLRWSYGKDKSVKCDKCRKLAWNDRYSSK